MDCNYKQQRATLRRRVNRARKDNTVRNQARIIDHVLECAESWDQYGWPDTWHEFKMAMWDAEFEIQYTHNLRCFKAKELT